MLRIVERSKLLSLMKEHGGAPRFTLPTQLPALERQLFMLAIVDADESNVE